MSKTNDVVAAKNQTIQILLIALVCVSILGGMMGAGWMRAPERITLHYPPDLSQGAWQDINEIPKANIYTFVYYIFQQLNRWDSNGEEDYLEKIHILRDYLTPRCYQDRLDDYQYKKSKNELSHRERVAREIPGRTYSGDRVVQHSGDRWVVSLDLHITETYRGEKVKDRFINYPITVVRYNVDPESNPWGLALDCFASTPRAIEIEQKEAP